MPRDLQCGAASAERFMIASSGDYKKGLSGGMTGASYICIMFGGGAFKLSQALSRISGIAKAVWRLRNASPTQPALSTKLVTKVIGLPRWGRIKLVRAHRTTARRCNILCIITCTYISFK